MQSRLKSGRFPTLISAGLAKRLHYVFFKYDNVYNQDIVKKFTIIIIKRYYTQEKIKTILYRQAYRSTAFWKGNILGAYGIYHE